MEKGIQLLPDTASSFADKVNPLFAFMVAVSAFFILLIVSLVLFFTIRYRRRRRTDRPAGVHGNNLLEITWSVIPLILALVMFFWGVNVYFHHARPPGEVMEILVTGRQWMWKIQHPTGKREVNELHVPLGKAVKLTMTSEDVIHSFFVPAFRMKMDVLPGRYTQTWFRPTKTGTYHLFCAEYCGTEHSKMGGWVHVVEPEEYRAWLAGDIAAATPVKTGEELFARLGCAACHAEDSGARGPHLAGVFGAEQTLVDGTKVLADETYLRNSILQPNEKLVRGYQAIMPTFKDLVDEDQILHLIAYIKSLRKDSAPGGTPG